MEFGINQMPSVPNPRSLEGGWDLVVYLKKRNLFASVQAVCFVCNPPGLKMISQDALAYPQQLYRILQNITVSCCEGIMFNCW